MSTFDGNISINIGGSHTHSHENRPHQSDSGASGDIQNQYRIAVESAERFEDRIITQIRFGFLFLTLLFTFYAWLVTQEISVATVEGVAGEVVPAVDDGGDEGGVSITNTVLGIAIPVLLFAVYWFWIIRTLVNRSLLKWHIVRNLEACAFTPAQRVFSIERANVDPYSGRLGHDVWVFLAGGVLIVTLSVVTLLLTGDEVIFVWLSVTTTTLYIGIALSIEWWLRRRVRQNTILATPCCNGQE